MTSSVSVKCTKKNLQSLPTAEDWESENKLGGLKPLMKSRLKNVRAQVAVNISSRLAGYPSAKTIALAALNITTEFVSTMMNYMLET